MKHFLIILSVIATLLPIGSYSQSEDEPTSPTEIECGRARVENDGVNASFIFSEDVLLRATNMELRCDLLEVFTKRLSEEENTIGTFSSIRKIIATGNVSIMQAERTATAGKAEVLPNEEKVVLYDNPIVVQNGYTFTGHQLVIERGKGRIYVPGSENKRVRVVGPAIKDLGFEEDNDPNAASDLAKEIKADEEREAAERAKAAEQENESPAEDDKEALSRKGPR